MKRTTLPLDDDLLKDLKIKAAQEGTTLAKLVNQLLREVVKSRSRRPHYKLQLKGWDAEMQPGVDLTDRNKLWGVMDGQ